MLNKRKVDIACIQETKWKGKKTLMIGDEYKLYYNGIVSNRNGVGIILSQDLTSSVVEVKRISERLMKIKLCIGQSILHILSVYAPQTGCKAEEKDDFITILDEAVMEISKNDLVIIGDDKTNYKKYKRIAKKVVARAKSMAYDDMYEDLKGKIKYTD
ncbi:craniofacial development protein 2-like [Gordionus sp. m RMFG-2023]|uniref:craniofacial development protein 2-like n=1 Tax=Gordionus sp. m RMFG-2023 TaxID=3053472 RepID=UPI0031FC3D59